MKRLIGVLCIVGIIIGLVSCGSDQELSTTETQPIASTVSSTTATIAESTSAQTTASELQVTTAATTAVSTTESTTSAQPATHVKGVFDEDRIVFSFAAISDTHTSLPGNTLKDTGEKTAKALSVLKKWALKNDADGLDAVIHVGDIVNSHNKDNINLFKKIYDENFDVEKVPLVYCLGDGHDLTWSADATAWIADYTTIFGSSYYLYDVAQELIADGNRHCVINGYHFIALEPVSRSPITYDAKTKEWFDRTLSDITSEDPDAYVFVLTHPMITNTAYGSDLGDSWATSDLTDILSKYPQVIIFGGHLHYPINDERSIMQTNFTAIGCGAVFYTCVETEVAGSAITLTDETNQGLLVQLDNDGDVRITRIDFENDMEIKTAWELSAPMADGSHLTRYSQKRGDDNTAPSFAEDATIEIIPGNMRKVRMVATAATDDDMVHHYILKVTDVASQKTTVTRQEAEYYLYSDISSISETIEFRMNLDTGKEYLFELYAYDSWGAISDPLTLTYQR